MSRILIIDDDRHFREMLGQMLERAGYDIMEAINGKDGLRLLEMELFDLIITDLIMPEKEGIETIMEVIHNFPSLKIIAISGGGRNGPQEYLTLAKRLGAHKTLVKPFRRKDVIKAVEEVLCN